jgi:hypothetical protein
MNALSGARCLRLERPAVSIRPAPAALANGLLSIGIDPGLPHDGRLRIAMFLDGFVSRIRAAIEPSHHSLRHEGIGLPEGGAEIKEATARGSASAKSRRSEN